MLSLVDPTPEQTELADSLYTRAFPLNERIPLELIHRSCACEGFRYRCIADDGEFVGLCYTIETSDILYVVYLAIDDTRRSGGYGSRTLSLLKSEGKRMFLNIEPVVEDCDNLQQRVKRREFYIRNGFSEHGILDAPDGNTFMVMTANGDVSDDEINAIYRSETLNEMLRNAGSQ